MKQDFSVSQENRSTGSSTAGHMTESKRKVDRIVVFQAIYVAATHGN